MVVYYCTFRVVTDDRAAFDDWVVSLVRRCRTGHGCIAYEYSISPEHPERGILFGAFDSQENFDAHRVSSAHIEMRAFGEDRGMTDKLVDYWVNGVHQPAHRPESTSEVLELVRLRRLAEAEAPR
jgi:quinol monooxygenase YgiN